MLCYTVLYCTVLHCTVLHYTALYRTVQYSIVQLCYAKLSILKRCLFEWLFSIDNLYRKIKDNEKHSGERKVQADKRTGLIRQMIRDQVQTSISVKMQ